MRKIPFFFLGGWFFLFFFILFPCNPLEFQLNDKSLKMKTIFHLCNNNRIIIFPFVLRFSLNLKFFLLKIYIPFCPSKVSYFSDLMSFVGFWYFGPYKNKTFHFDTFFSTFFVCVGPIKILVFFFFPFLNTLEIFSCRFCSLFTIFVLLWILNFYFVL